MFGDDTTEMNEANNTKGWLSPMPDDQRLIDTATQEEVTVAGPVLADGRVLVQKTDGDLLAVIDVKRLKPQAQQLRSTQ